MLHIFFIVVHSGSLLPGERNFSTRHLTFNIFFSVEVQKLLILKHLFEESWLDSGAFFDFSILNLFSPVPFYLLIPVLFIGFECLLLLDCL